MPITPQQLQPGIQPVSEEEFNSLASYPHKLQIDGTSFPNLQFSITEFNLPGISIGNAPLAYKQMDVNMPGDKIVFDEFSVTFKIDENFRNYKEVLNWMVNLIKKRDDEVDKKRDMTILFYDEQYQLKDEIKFNNGYPTSLSSVPFSSTNKEHASCTCTFNYDYFEFK